MTAKKKILAVLCSFVAVVAIVVASVMGTVAYLTSSAAVSNVFTIGNVTMHMYETKVDNNGNPVEFGKKTASTNEYLLVNGNKYTKDPTIYIDKGSVASYLFIIARNDIASIEDFDELTMKEQLLVKGWMKYGVAATGNIYVYTGIEAGESADAWAAAVEAITTADETNPLTKTSQGEKQIAAENRAAALEELYTTFNGGVKAIGVGSATENVEVDLFDHFTIRSYADLSIHASSKVTITAVAIQTSSSDFGSDIGSKTALDAAWAAVISTYPTIHVPTAN